MITFERETDEFQPVALKINDVVVTTGLEYAIVALAERPITVWTPAETHNGQLGFWARGLAPGFYEVHARVTIGDEHPTRKIGHLAIT